MTDPIHDPLQIRSADAGLLARALTDARDRTLSLLHASAGDDDALDRAPVTWGAYLPFIEAGAYDDPKAWTSAGGAW